jgi:hypothetical protein
MKMRIKKLIPGHKNSVANSVAIGCEVEATPSFFIKGCFNITAIRGDGSRHNIITGVPASHLEEIPNDERTL